MNCFKLSIQIYNSQPFITGSFPLPAEFHLISVTQYLNWWYRNHLIGPGGLHAWPSHSPNLTPLDFYLWGYVKGLVYQEKSQTQGELLWRIMDGATVIWNIHESIQKATHDVLKQARLCIANARGYFKEQAA
jgi:hypothetical protein